ncbi:MAG: hypothetical protein Q9163_005295 [Psora crenata]
MDSIRGNMISTTLSHTVGMTMVPKAQTKVDRFSARRYSSQVRPVGLNPPPQLSPIEEQEDDYCKVSEARRKRDTTTVKNDSKNPRQSIRDSLSVEQLSDLLFSRQHLQLLLEDQHMSEDFKAFIQTYRPASVPLLARYLNFRKALKAILYAEALFKGLHAPTDLPLVEETSSIAMPWVVQGEIEKSLDPLLEEDFRAFVAHVYVKIVDDALAERVVRKRASTVPIVADGLAEVFVLSDPGRPDNVIAFASQDFQEMTGYPRKEFIGRNCRLLAGPRTSPLGTRRFRASLEAEREHCEVLLN